MDREKDSRPLFILALGDSTTAGTPGFRSPVEAPPDGDGDVESQYAHWLMRQHPDWRVLNHGVNGERSDQIRGRFEQLIADRDAEAHAPFSLLVVVAGVNDIYQGRSAQRVEHELAAIYERARAAGLPAVAGSILPYDTATADQNARMHAVNDWIREYAATHDGIVYCDTRQAVTAPDRADRLISSPDGLHPSPDGYRRMAGALEPAIARLLRQVR